MPEISRHAPSSETGFTLIELLVVIAIILIVASFALPAYNRIVTRSHEAVLRDDLFTMRQMLNRYTLDNHQPPESRRGASVLSRKLDAECCASQRHSEAEVLDRPEEPALFSASDGKQIPRFARNGVGNYSTNS